MKNRNDNDDDVLVSGKYWYRNGRRYNYIGTTTFYDATGSLWVRDAYLSDTRPTPLYDYKILQKTTCDVMIGEAGYKNQNADSGKSAFADSREK